MQFGLDCEGVTLHRSDFGSDLRSYIAFRLATLGATSCRDKESALELLMHEADVLIETVQNGKPPE